MSTSCKSVCRKASDSPHNVLSLMGRSDRGTYVPYTTCGPIDALDTTRQKGTTKNLVSGEPPSSRSYIGEAYIRSIPVAAFTRTAARRLQSFVDF